MIAMTIYKIHIGDAMTLILNIEYARDGNEFLSFACVLRVVLHTVACAPKISKRHFMSAYLTKSDPPANHKYQSRQMSEFNTCLIRDRR